MIEAQMQGTTLKLSHSEFRLLWDFLDWQKTSFRIEPGISRRMKLRLDEIPAWKRLVDCIPTVTARDLKLKTNIHSKLVRLEANKGESC